MWRGWAGGQLCWEQHINICQPRPAPWFILQCPVSPHRNTNIGLIPHYSNDAAPSLWLHIFSTSASWHNHSCKEVPPMEANGIRFPQTKKSRLKCIKFNVVQYFPCEAGSRREKVMVTLFMFTQTHSDKILPLRPSAPYLSVCTSNCLEKRKVGLNFRRLCVIYRNIWTNNTIFLTIPFMYPPFARTEYLLL